MLFTLALTRIHFQGSQPRYPTLVQYHVPGGNALLPFEPALKSKDFAGEWGPFQVTFTFDADETAQFLSYPDGRASLSRIDGSLVEDPRWQAQVESDGSFQLTWNSTERPPTQVLRLDCARGPTALHLFFAIVEPEPVTPRIPSSGPLPDPLQDPPKISLVREADELVYDVFHESARSQLGTSPFQLEPAFRVPWGHELQFEIHLDLSTGKQFAQGFGADQVPVRVYAGELVDEALRPTERPDPRTCLVTWLADGQVPGPLRHFLAFNLEMEDAIGPLPALTRRRIDPTVIQDPYLPPPDPPSTYSPEDVEGGE